VFEERVQLKTGKNGAEMRKESLLRRDAVSAKMRKVGRYFSIKEYVVGRKEKSVAEKRLRFLSISKTQIYL
jgi:hypothetical protein